MTKEQNSLYKVFIYKIEPIILLDLSEDIKENIVLQYKEFLRQVNFDFQILIINKEYDLKKYFTNMSKTHAQNMKLYNEYILDMELKFKKESIFETYYYLIVSIKDNQYLNVENVDNTINILTKIGCKVKRIIRKEEICNILNMCINKE